MNTGKNENALMMLTIIVNHELGSKVLRIGKQCGISGGTIMLGRGTTCRSSSKWLGACELRKEIVMMISTTQSVEKTIFELDEKMKVSRPGNGALFTFMIDKLIGANLNPTEITQHTGGVNMLTNQIIFAVVNKGDAETVVSAAEAAGATGATIINGRGAGIHETSRLFSMEIEPEKEIVFIIAKREMVDTISSEITKRLDLQAPGKGILFVIDAQKTIGLFDG